MNDSSSVTSQSPPQPRRSWMQFRLRTLLLLVLLVAAFLGGRNSNNWFHSELEGSWEVRLPRGHVWKTNITRNDEGFFVIDKPALLSGIYKLSGDQLIVVRPTDDRMMGLKWSRSGDRWRLTAEPANKPTGASYVGTVMVKSSAKMSESTTTAQTDPQPGTQMRIPPWTK